jgi:hypothetical protein
MAEGTHWEWRGFGRISEEFGAAFAKLPRRSEEGPEWAETRDQYVFVRGSSIDVKLLSGGSQGGLKLKRLVSREGGLELWTESPREIYLFEQMDRYSLAELADLLGLTLRGHIRSGELAADHILSHLRAARPAAELVTVHEKRQTRIAASGVAVELVELTRVTLEGPNPALGMPLFSVGVVNVSDLEGRSGAARAAIGNEVRLVLAELGVGSEALLPLNYLQAMALWRNRLTRAVERSHVPRALASL